jgi:hypothetical protein
MLKSQRGSEPAHFKIGTSINVYNHVASLQSTTPYPIDIVMTKLMEHPEKAEHYFHNYLINLNNRIYNGWFELDPETALDLAILINKNPDIDVNEEITLNTISKKVDTLLDVCQKRLDIEKLKQEESKQEALIVSETEKKEFYDEKIVDAIRVCTQVGKASTSLLQRKLGIGYGRASRIVDVLEDLGAIGPADGAKPREVLMTAEELTSKVKNERYSYGDMPADNSNSGLNTPLDDLSISRTSS